MTFLPSNRKRVNVAGVLHEFDLFVTASHHGGYESRFAFECKHRETPVSKNDIIIFIAKLNAVAAQKGFFVAKQFSRHAVAQAAADARIELVTVTTSNVSRLPWLAVRVLAPGAEHIAVEVRTRDGDIMDPDAASWKPDAVLLLNDRRMAFQDYFAPWAVDLINAQNDRLTAAGLHVGSYRWTQQESRAFQPGELIIADFDISQLTFRRKRNVDR
jgi:hypothetical protein